MKWNALHDKSEWLFKKITEHNEEPVDDKALERLAEKLKERGYVGRKLREQRRFDYLKAYQQVVHPGRRRVPRGLLKIAAAIVILVGAGILAYIQLSPHQEVHYDDIIFADVKPGGRKAFLIKHDGQEVELGSDPGSISEQNGIDIHVDSTGLRYEEENVPRPDVALYNTLVVPRGGEYSLVLSDGTKVWLNAESQLKYPVVFCGDTREVSVSGEAYFEVTKRDGMPFVVKTDLGNITVLGTEFNVCSYPEREEVVTTLVRGKVSCRLPDGKDMILSPREQLSINERGEYACRRVDTYYFTCWKDGVFLFEEMRLEDILEQLARWYDIHVFYTNEVVKNLHFTGDLSRFRNIDTFIEMFEKSSDVKFTMKGRTLMVGM